MKIGIVLSKTPSYSETFFISKIKGLQENGHQVVLFTQSKAKDFTLCPVKTSYPIKKGNLFLQSFYFLGAFVKLLAHRGAVLRFIKIERRLQTSFRSILKKIYVNAHILSQKLDWLHFGFATMALGKENVAKSIKLKMAVSFRGFDMAIYPIKHPNCYDLLWKSVDKVHTISDDLYQLALAQGLSKTIPVQKITPAIDIALFASETNSIRGASPLRIITTARLHWKKGLTDTLMALKNLKDIGVSFHYTIVGEGPEYEKLAFLRHTLDLTKEVTFIGKISHSMVKELLAANEIYLQYSVSEGFCNAVLEAQAMGLLCIVSDAEGLSENVLNKKSGWVVAKRDPKKLAETIMTVFEMTSKEKNTIREFAVNRVQKEFNLEKQQQEFLQFYTGNIDI